MISVVIPTIEGRQHWLRQCLDGYEETTAAKMEIIIIRNRPTCGIAWQEGADQATGDYIHFSADDLIPHPGWWETAIESVENGELPCPVIFNPNGTLQSAGTWDHFSPEGARAELARVPFLSREQWELIGPMEPWHYYTDNLITFKGEAFGIPTVVRHGYRFTHHFAPEGRLDGAGGRFNDDWIAFENFKDRWSGR